MRAPHPHSGHDGSKVGKSRTLFEALRRCALAGQLQLVAPVDGDALRSLLDPGQAMPIRAEYAVLWLDDLELFLNDGVTLRTLREWQSGGPGRIVAATYGGKGSELIAGTAIGGLATIATDVLQHAQCEEDEEFSALDSELSDDERKKLTSAVQLAERIAPTHPHAGVESGAANFAVGPFVSLLDRARDALSDAFG